MTERLDDIVGEMRNRFDHTYPRKDPFMINQSEMLKLADRILAAAALERAEHRRQLEEALAPATREDWSDPHELASINYELTARRSRLLKEET